MYTWFDACTLLIVGAATLAAAITDHRTLRIPNRLTLPLISLGLSVLGLRCIGGFSMPAAALTCAVSYVFVYGLWELRLWGGGDAKLVLALFLLVSPLYPSLYYIAAFSLCLALVLFVKHALLKGRGARAPMGPALFFAYVLSIGALTAVSAA